MCLNQKLPVQLLVKVGCTCKSARPSGLRAATALAKPQYGIEASCTGRRQQRTDTTAAGAADQLSSAAEAAASAFAVFSASAHSSPTN